MFERFTHRARRVVVLAEEEARLLNHESIGAEHLLLGLIHEAEEPALTALQSVGLSIDVLRAQVAGMVGPGGTSPEGHIGLTPRAKTLLDRVARGEGPNGRDSVGTEHILFNLLGEEDDVISRMMAATGLASENLQRAVVQLTQALESASRRPTADWSIRANGLGIRFWLRHHDHTIHHGIVRVLKRKPRADEFWALRDVSFELGRGEIFGVIGPNGSGKSTLLRTIGRIYHPDEGTISIRGKVSSLMTLGAGFHPQLSGLDNIEINGILLGLRKEQLAAKLKSIIEFADLGNFITAPVRTYSTGMRARLGFSVAVHVDPEILVVDEVLGVGDASFRTRSTDKIRELFEKGTTVVMVQHDMRTIADLCHRVMWLEKGRVQMIDEPLSVVNAYLGSRGLPALPDRP